MTRSHLSFPKLHLSFCFISIIMLCGFAPAPVLGQNDRKIVAVVNGRNITQAELDDSIFADLFALEQQIYALRKSALDNLVTRTILEAEAARQNISVEELRKQFTAGTVEVEPESVNESYQEHRLAFGNMSGDEARERIRLDLESSARMQKYREQLTKLQENSEIALLLEEPRLPAVTFLNSPGTGAEKPRVLILEFADFQCPYCRSSQPVLKELLKTYKDEVRLVFKHLPLEIHSEAFAASQAAFCAGQQNAFWPYHDVLLSSEELSAETFEKLASALHLDLPKFKTCLTSAESRRAVEKDLDEARHFGITSTPTFVINGKTIRGALELKQFKTIINAELKRAAGNNQ